MRALTLSLALLAVGWLILGLGLVLDARRGSPEPTIRRYLTDLEAHRLEAASATLTPSAAERWRDFLEFQQFNHYGVVSVAVRSPSLIEAILTRTPWRATHATLVADVLEPSGIRWRGSTIVPLELRDGVWLLERPPFASGEPAATLLSDRGR
jgi:hypothetical protein